MTCPGDSRLQRARAVLRALDHGVGSAAGAAAGPPPLRPLPCMALARGRVHEVVGPARHALAVLSAGAAAREGPVVWLRPGWRQETLCPQGFGALTSHGAHLAEALIIAHCRRETDMLGAMEEALRAGCVALVLAEIGNAPDLRQIRRLHLAAAEGGARAGAGDAARATDTGIGSMAPLGLLLAQERADSRISGVESRWALHPLPPAANPAPATASTGPCWRLERLRARDAPPAQWQLAVTGPAHGAGGMQLQALPAEN